MPCCEISDCAQVSKTIIAVRHFGLGGRESLETAVNLLMFLTSAILVILLADTMGLIFLMYNKGAYIRYICALPIIYYILITLISTCLNII